MPFRPARIAIVVDADELRRERICAQRLTALGVVPMLGSRAQANCAMNAPAAATAIAPQLVAFDLIRTLVSYDTTSRESNLALIHWVRDYLVTHGISSQLTYDDERRKANLFATLPAQDGNTTLGGIVLSGHTD